MAKKYQTHPTDDPLLNILVNLDGIIGDYVRDFPGSNRLDENPKWFENWFLARISYYFSSPIRESITEIDFDSLLANIIDQQVTFVKKPATISYIWPHYFRGFRNLESPINLCGRLIVIDGNNSSGKTSLAEAFEWLLSGALVRRSMLDMGDAKELENCISNQLRPDTEQTWVEAEFSTLDGEKLVVKRVLIKDYGDKKSSVSESQLYVNGKLVTRKEEETFFDDLLAGIPPVLMQHSLRTFVLSTPSQRRDYFERLLRLDELAHLIEKSVFGDARLPEFPSKFGSVAWTNWEGFRSKVDGDSKKELRRAEQTEIGSLRTTVETALSNVARREFKISEIGLTIDEIKRTIEAEQQKVREKEFPLLEALRPVKVIDAQLEKLFSGESIKQYVAEIAMIYPAYSNALTAAKKVGEADLAVAKALDELEKLGLISSTSEPQECPLCEYKATPTLIPSRISAIKSWSPIQQAATNSKETLNKKVALLLTEVNNLVIAKSGLLPSVPDDTDWGKAILHANLAVANAANACRTRLSECHQYVKGFDEFCEALVLIAQSGLQESGDVEKVIEYADKLIQQCPVVLDKAHEYNDSFAVLDNVVGSQSRQDAEYNLKDVWIALVEDFENLVTDILWERSKKLAQNEIEKIRTVLLGVRQKLIEKRRGAFNDGMTSIWGKLRSDKYSIFSRLFIPEPKGKGLPLEIHVKAELDDGQQKKEVDALRVFSESQINILGIAAFATRSSMLGHRFMVLDDPVQSMDEEHFKTFSKQLLPELIGDHGQVIVLTHNDTFARELSYSNIEFDEYVTLSVRHSRRTGCEIDEGNRRVAERLKNAEKLCEEGKLKDAWLAIRTALERLYTITYIEYGPEKFNPFSWIDQTAEYMWDDRQGGGVGKIIETKIPGSGERLKEILKMTASGAHDKAANGATDIENAIKDVRKTLTALKLGSG